MQSTKSNPGLIKLTQKYRTIFRIPENLNYYSKEDLQIAERKFIKVALEDGMHFIHRKVATNRLYSA